MVFPFARLRSTPAVVWRALLLAALLIPMLADDAAAGRAWCRTDPLVSIDGELADIFVVGPITALLDVTGPNEIVVTVPEGVRTRLILNDLGFGRGNKVTFKESDRLQVIRSGVEVQVDVRVPARDDDMPIRVEFGPRILGILWPAEAKGTANEWMTLRTTF